MKPNIRSWRKNWSFMNFQEETYQESTDDWTENGIWNVSIMALREVPDFNPPTFLQVQTQVIGSKSERGQSETRFVCLFIWCCLQHRICYVCTLISSMELFIVLKMGNLHWFDELSEYAAITRNIAWIYMYLEQDMKRSFHSKLMLLLSWENIYPPT